MPTSAPSSDGGEPAIGAGGIVAFGDSTTAFRPGAIQQVYSVRLQAALKGADCELPVHNAGRGGNTTRDAKARFERDVLGRRPAIIIIQFGINDSAVDVWRTPPATKPRVAIDQYEANLRWMIAAAREQDAAVILMTTNPLRWTPRLKEVYGRPPYEPDSDTGFDAPLLAKYNDVIRRVAKENQVELVDIRAAMFRHASRPGQSLDALLLDGMHPNDDAHALIAEQLAPVVLKLHRARAE
ncbi:MAG: hypothetical protein KDA47_05235 [Planctomycetales bacterium]|nr:hypothetical protein [Planctomycetales bacterium]